MRRYMLVTHPREDEKLKVENNQIKGQHPGHHHMESYHWARIDDDHILVVGNFSVSHHAVLHNHPKISVMPHIGSNKPLHTHVAHQGHKKALVALGIHMTDHTMEDFIDKVVAQHGPLFSPDK